MAVLRSIDNRRAGQIRGMKQHKDCPFCGVSGYLQGEQCVARFDKYPVAPGYTLVVPESHVPTWFEMSASEQIDAVRLKRMVKDYLDKEYKPDGYNIGMNCGTDSRARPHSRHPTLQGRCQKAPRRRARRHSG